ncbi:cytochrome c3 family protein [bacterium]|nr:cytochrome c3 family protein [bacterium]
MEPTSPSYRHTFRLFALIGIAVVIALIVRARLVPESYGDLGHFRADAIEDAKRFEPRHLGPAACVECHDDVVALHAKDAHARVTCESCHGPGAVHVASEGEGGIIRPGGKEPCLVCHRLLPARPGEFAQIVPRDHYRFVGVEDPEIDCVACHDPHEPLFMDRDLRTARLHPLIHRCRDCHAGRTDETLSRPPGHPAIFECGYCHAEVVSGFAERPHSGVRCTICHLFFRESDFAGRILRDSDPRFCLLCHREADFRSDDAPPGIAWPDHGEDMAEDAGDLDKRCIDCHQDRIHPLQTRTAAGDVRAGREE